MWMRAEQDVDQTKEQCDQEDKRDESPSAEVSRVIGEGRESVMLPEPRDLVIVLEIKKEMSGKSALFADMAISTESGLVKISTEALRTAKRYNPF